MVDDIIAYATPYTVMAIGLVWGDQQYTILTK